MTSAPNPPPYPPVHGVYPRPRRRGRTVVVVLLAVVAGALLLCVGGVLLGGNHGGPLGGRTPPPSPTSPKVAGLGDPVRDGRFEFTVTKVTYGVRHVGPAGDGEDAQGQFVLVSLTVRNVGDEPQVFDGSDQRAFDAAGRSYGDDPAAELDANARSETFLQDVNPGNHVAGVVVFDVPATSRLVRLELHDSPFSRGASVAVD